MGNPVTGLITSQRKEPSATPSGFLTGANDGLSLAPDGVTAQLGEPVANPQSGASRLLDARYIPMNNFPFLYGLTNHPNPSDNDNFVIDPFLGVYINYLDGNGKYPYFALSQQDLAFPYIYFQRDPSDPTAFLWRYSAGGGDPGNAIRMMDSGNVSIDVYPSAPDDGIGKLQVHGSQTLYDTPVPTNPSKGLLGPDSVNNQLVLAALFNSNTQTGDGVTTTFTIPHSLNVIPSQVLLTPNSAAAAALYYVSNKTAIDFDVTFLIAPGAAAVSFDFQVIK